MAPAPSRTGPGLGAASPSAAVLPAGLAGAVPLWDPPGALPTEIRMALWSLKVNFPEETWKRLAADV